ncbi:MAG TPA: hypothetical protein VFP68_16895, partial [Burkholderiaceae bacterium]|nr:hypothetical protein [Burkholderiaceae bacterium]
SSRLNQTELRRAFEGNTTCAVRGSERWQEQHRVGGELWDYKKGANDPLDPTTKVGNWSIVSSGNNARLVYNYGSGGSSVYDVYQNGANYSFCGSGVEVIVTVKAGLTSC